MSQAEEELVRRGSSPDISLALEAMAREGRQPLVVSHSWWKENAAPGVDYLVLQDDTWKEWVRE